MWNVNIKSFINFIAEEYDTFIRGLNKIREEKKSKDPKNLKRKDRKLYTMIGMSFSAWWP